MTLPKLSNKTAVFLVALGMGLAGLGACAPEARNSPAGKEAGGSGKYDHLSAEEKLAMSDVLADEGEEIMVFETLPEAFGKFSESLQLNAGNTRAQLWREILKPILELKGMAARIRPLYIKQPGGQERYRKFINSLKDSGTPGYHRFLTDGPNDIENESDFREWMDRTIVNLDTLRTFIKANKDREYDLRAPSVFLNNQMFTMGSKRTKGCETNIAGMRIKFGNCDQGAMLAFKANRADLELLQYMVVIHMMQLSVLYAYHLNPLSPWDARGGETPRQVIAKLVSGYDGSLFERNHLNLGKSVMADAAIAQRYFIENLNENCPKGVYDPENRKGYLFAIGLCMKSNEEGHAMRTLEVMEVILSGAPVKVEQSELAEPVEVIPLKFFSEPPKNALPLLPTEYRSDGIATRFDDRAWSPFFSRGSLNVLYTAQRKEEERKRREAEARSASRIDPLFVAPDADRPAPGDAQ